MVTKMRKKIHSLLGTKNSLQGLWSGGKLGLWGQKWHQKSKKKRNFMMLSIKKQSAGALKLGDWLQIWSKKKKEPGKFPHLPYILWHLKCQTVNKSIFLPGLA